MKQTERFGVDLRQFKILFRLFLTLDLRRGRADKKRRLSPLFLNLIFYTFMGLSLAGSIVQHASLFMYALLTLTYAMFMAASAVILELSQTLVDPEEKDLLTFRPVHSRTYFTAKLANLLFYTGCVTVALSLFPTFVSLGLDNAVWFFPLLFFPVALLAGFVTGALMAILYSTLIRLFNTERLKDGIAFFQIGLTFVIIVLFQWIPRIDPNLLNQSPAAWMGVLPPAWFAGLFSAAAGQTQTPFLLLSFAAVIGSVILVFAGFRKIAAHYLDLIQPQVEPAPIESDIKSGRKRIPTHGLFADPERRAGYILASQMLSRDRFTKMGTYPLLGIPLAFLLISFQNGGMKDPFRPDASLGFQQSGALFLYMFFFVYQSLIQSFTYSRDWEAAWVYPVAPVVSGGKLFQGVKLAILLRLVLPFFGILFVIFSFQMPAGHALKHLLFLGMGGLAAFSVGSFWIKDPPFSKERTQGGRISRMFALALTLPLFAGWVALQKYAYADPDAYRIAFILLTIFLVLTEWVLHPRMHRIRLAE